MPRTGEEPGNSIDEHSVARVGQALRQDIAGVLDSILPRASSPQSLVRALKIDKVLASRMLKALRAKDPVAVVFRLPGPEPIRRLLRAALKAGASEPAVRSAQATVDRFEEMIRSAGDRSSLDAIVSAWLPEARRDFQLRRKQSVFKAMSQLKGVMATTTVATVLLHPSDDGTSIDIVWILGLLGFQRLRPDVYAKLVTRRIVAEGAPRHPQNLSGHPIRSVEDARLDQFCEAPPAQIAVRQLGDIHQYVLDAESFDPHSTADLVLVEVNYREMPRFVPRDADRRKGYVFAEITVPCRFLLFDVLVHEAIYPRSEPQLLIYDTAIDGTADVNDPVRDLDRLHLVETIQALGQGAAIGRDTNVPRYAEMLRYVFDQLGWDDLAFRGYRCGIDYPLYGSQVAMAFDPPAPE